eukprot:10641828-Heterocapsa_arctica.AAC.1
MPVRAWDDGQAGGGTRDLASDAPRGGLASPMAPAAAAPGCAPWTHVWATPAGLCRCCFSHAASGA